MRNITSSALYCSHLIQSYGGHKVLTDVNLDVAYGEILALLGRNGAGKSTLLSIACGFQRPESGTILTAGMMPSNTSDSAFGLRVGLAPQRLGIYPQLTVRQNLTSTAMLHGYSKRQSLKATDEVIEMLGLADQCTVRAEHLSGGQQRRLHTGMALVHHPSVLFLDEATVGADVEARADILATVKRLASEGTAVVYTTHYLEEVESLQADVAFLVEGSIADHGSLQSMIAAHATPSIQVTFACDRQPLANGWIAVNGHLEPQQPINEAGRALAELLGQPSTAGLQLKDVEVIHADINNAYLNVVGTAAKKVQA